MPTPADTDATLLRDYAANATCSSPAFTEFVSRRIGFIYATALRQTSGDAHLAHDITQDVFLTVTKKAAALARHAQLTGWLHTTTCLITRRALRDARLRREREQEAATMLETDQENSRRETAALARMRESLDEILCSLDDHERQAILMRYFENRAYPEIGSALRLNEDAARMRVNRAMDKMRSLYARRGIASTTAALGALMTAEAATAAPVGMAATMSATILAATTTASATTTVGGITTLLALMTTTKATITVLIVALAALGGAYYATQTERTTARALAAAEKTHAQLQRQLQSTERRASEQNDAQPSAASTTASSTTQPLNPIEAGQAFMDAHPEVRQKFNALIRAYQTGRYASVYHKLGWDAGQIASFEDQNPMPMRFGDVYDVPGYGRVIIATNSTDSDQDWTTTALRNAIGDAAAAPFMESDKIQRNDGSLPNELASALWFTDSPLTPEQSQQLTDAWVSIAQAQGRATRIPPDWDALIDKARAFLSPAQLDAFISIKAADDYSYELRGWNPPKAKKSK